MPPRSRSTLWRLAQLAITLAVSGTTGRDYFGKLAGYRVEQTREMRAGGFAGDTHINDTTLDFPRWPEPLQRAPDA